MRLAEQLVHQVGGRLGGIDHADVPLCRVYRMWQHPVELGEVGVVSTPASGEQLGGAVAANLHVHTKDAGAIELGAVVEAGLVLHDDGGEREA